MSERYTIAPMILAHLSRQQVYSGTVQDVVQATKLGRRSVVDALTRLKARSIVRSAKSGNLYWIPAWNDRVNVFEVLGAVECEPGSTLDDLVEDLSNLGLQRDEMALYLDWLAVGANLLAVQGCCYSVTAQGRQAYYDVGPWNKAWPSDVSRAYQWVMMQHLDHAASEVCSLVDMPEDVVAPLMTWAQMERRRMFLLGEATDKLCAAS